MDNIETYKVNGTPTATSRYSYLRRRMVAVLEREEVSTGDALSLLMGMLAEICASASVDEKLLFENLTTMIVTLKSGRHPPA